ncbi:MAG: hypothetical protein JKX76_15265 [Colwellia sp.]|nr:hypothetical protein [Colwellia sp.]
MSKLVVVLSGQIVRENSANLMNFWKGFINIQNTIYDIDDLEIIAHSWNPEFNQLVENVYDIKILSSQKQQSFVKEFMPLINPVNKFEKGLKRVDSTWKNVSAQTIFGQIKSKIKSISLLNKLNISDDTLVLSTRWDIGCSGSLAVNSLNFDTSLSPDYLYLAYFSEVDEGYADMWFLGSYQNIKKFEAYENHLLESISDKNSYFDDFTNNGWTLAIAKDKVYEFVKRYKIAILNKILIKVPFNLFKRLLPFIKNKIIGLEQRIKNNIELPFLSGENSLLKDSKTSVLFPDYQALNIHAILKSFILDNGLREKTRFLDVNDFVKTHNGQMINSLDFAYVIYSHSSYSDCWDMAIGQAKECLPENCKKIYLVSDNSSETIEAFIKFKNDEKVELLIYENEQKYTNRLIKAFSEVNVKFDFIYFVHEDMPLVNKVDKVYLNTLLHYMNNSNEFYIKLVDTNYVDKKEDHSSFPNLVHNSGGYSFSVQASLMKPDFLVSFLGNFDTDIYGLEQICIESNFKFSAVKGDVKVGRYLLNNNYFPHISTAISKGKWVTSEWKDDITYLSDKYNIDLSIRGEV